MDNINIKAYAKINLDLEILGKLDNGYHEIRSIFQAVDIFDTISISKADSFSLTGTTVCENNKNLVFKARKKLEKAVNKKLLCNIHLIKSLPVSAGLGGGSTDAAAVIVGLNQLFELGLSVEELIRIGAEVGADIPFFIANKGTALVQGIGEKIIPLDRKPAPYYVLARPHKRIDTAEIYKKHDETGDDFFKIVSEICSDTKKMKNYLDKFSRDVGMSGSGPTVFAGFGSYKSALESIEAYGVMEFNGDFFICRPCEVCYDIF